LPAPFPETVVFDLDGTLVDTAPDLTAALNAVLTRAGRNPVGLDEVRHMVGRGAKVLIERAMAASGPPASEAEVDDFMAHFLEHYDANIAATSRPFTGVETLARKLKAGGHKLGICTNKPIGLSLKLLDLLNLRPLFPVVLGADSRPYKKPDPRHLFDTIAELGGRNDSAVLIGDSETDVKTARAANIPVVVVSFGYTEIPPRELGGDVVIDHFDALEQAFAAIPRLT
jgi:phosphoglycolate phosphatase